MSHNLLGRILVIAALLGLSGCGNSGVSPDAANSSTSDNSSSNAGGNSALGGGSTGGANKSSGGLGSMLSAKPIVVDAGTQITVTADQSVSSKTSNPGDHFDVSLASPVTAGEKVVIPSGARATGTVTDAKSAGKFKGNAAISVTLSSITVNGREYDVKTNSVTEVSKGRGKRTAVGAGGGAAVGAIIGAIAGGGKGAAIGAGAGAGAGTAGAAFTGDRDITIAAETKLHFRLSEPLEIKAK